MQTSTGTTAARTETVREALSITKRTKNTAIPMPIPPMSHQKRLPSKPQVRPLESDAALVSVNRNWFLVSMGDSRLGWAVMFFVLAKGADADRAAGVEAEDFVERIDHRRGGGDDGSAEDGHLALIHVPAPDGEAAIDD
jgi:hypothetical protein